MHAISIYRGNRPTNTPPTHTHRQDRLQYTAPQLARSVNIVERESFLMPRIHKNTDKKNRDWRHMIPLERIFTGKGLRLTEFVNEMFTNGQMGWFKRLETTRLFVAH